MNAVKQKETYCSIISKKEYKSLEDDTTIRVNDELKIILSNFLQKWQPTEQVSIT